MEKSYLDAISSKTATANYQTKPHPVSSNWMLLTVEKSNTSDPEAVIIHFVPKELVEKARFGSCKSLQFCYNIRGISRFEFCGLLHGRGRIVTAGLAAVLQSVPFAQPCISFGTESKK